MIEIMDLQVAYVACFQKFYSLTHRLPIWYVTNHKKYSIEFSSLYSLLMQYDLLDSKNTIYEFFLYTFNNNDYPLKPKQLGVFYYVGDFIRSGRNYGKDLRLKYFR